MSTIESGDTVYAIIVANDVTPSAADLALWNTVDIPTLTETNMSTNAWDLKI